MKIDSGIIVGGLCALMLAGFAEFETSRRMDLAHAQFESHARDEYKIAVKPVETALTHIYQNLRTLAALPSVKNIDRHATNLGGDGRETIQQVYNNIASSVAVSEVYVLPASFDPEKIDPVTGKKEEPVIMFDELIVNAASRVSPQVLEAVSPDALEEIESYEYEEFYKQIAWLKEKYPTRDTIDGLNIPIIGSKSMITCDNTYFIHTGKDADRSGILFSVPFYNDNGVFSGVVAAIILDRALTNAMPEPDMALVNETYNYRVGTSIAIMESSDYIHAQTIPLNFNDPRGKWSIQIAEPVSEFYETTEVKAANSFRFYSHLLILVLFAAGYLVWRSWKKGHEASLRQNQLLEQRVSERTSEISHLAEVDSLTGLKNRAFMSSLMSAIPAAAKDESTKLTLMCLDLDDFKDINDSFGHASGDVLLKTVAQRLEHAAGGDAVVARWGGDEFVILFIDMGEKTEANAAAEILTQAVGEPILINGEEIRQKISIGIAMCPEDGVDAETLMRRADLALYAVKSTKNGGHLMYSKDLEAASEKKRTLERELLEGIEKDQFCLYYQPIVDIPSGKLLGFEALLRWKHPVRGMVAPNDFIPAAESSGLIVEIGAKVLQKACTFAAGLPEHLTIAVNLSPVQMRRNSIVLTVTTALEKSGLKPERLELEITETVLLHDAAEVQNNLQLLRQLGVAIALDDFGTGYSSLSYLQTFQIDRIKIDQSFVRNISDRPESLAIISTVTDLAKKLGMTTTVEGIETIEQMETLVKQGCETGQGYYFSRPMPEADALLFIGTAPQELLMQA